MTTQTARVWNQQQIAYCPHTSISGETWQYVRPGITTSAGSAAGTTLIDTNTDSGGADTYNGRYWVLIKSGALTGKWARIVDDDGAGTLTLEDVGFEAQVASAVQYEIWLSPEPVIVVDSSAAATDVVDAVRAEPAINSEPYWVGYWVVPITGNRRGEKAQVTNHVAGTGTFTVGTGFSGVLAAGDVCLLRRFIEASSINDGCTQEYIPRPSNRVNFSRGDGRVGAKGGTFGFQTQIIPSGALVADNARQAMSNVRGLLVSCGLDEIIPTTMTTSGGASTTTTVDIATGTLSRIVQPGMAIMVNGEMRFVTAIADGGGGVDTLTVTPPLSQAPATGVVVNVARAYAKSTSGNNYGCVIEWEIDGWRKTITGCKGNVSLVDGPVPMLSFEFSADHWIDNDEAAPYKAGTAYDTAVPVLSSDRICYLGTTLTSIGGLSATIGAETAPKNVMGACGINGRSGYHTTNVVGGASFREIMATAEGNAQLLRWDARTPNAFVVIMGSHGSAFAIRIPVARQIELPKPADAGGIVDMPIVLEAQDAGYTSGTIDAVATNFKVPDFAFFIM